jgi:hypothetical protein
MAARGNGAGRFHVDCSGAVIAEIRRIHRLAWNQGRGIELTRAFRQVIEALEIRPFNIGEEAYRLPGLRMQIRTVIVRPLVVDFAICEDRPLVFLKGVKLLSAPSTD